MISFLLIFLSTICNVYSADFTKTADQGEFNYFVTIWHRNEYHCSGTIIDRRHILTRAYCVSGIPSSDLSVIAGTVDTNNLNRTMLMVKSTHIYYGFKAAIDAVALDRINWVHDIAILKLVNEMIWNSLLAPIKLISGDYDWDTDHKCIVPGWRQSKTWRSQSRLYIRWIEASIVPDELCISLNVHLFENEKCTSWLTSSVKVVTYYSGSPIVCGDMFIGIIDGRKGTKFSSFLNLYPYMDFIGNAIDDTKTDVNSGEAPYVVSIWAAGSFQCGGIILDALHILTAGYCVQDAQQSDLRVIAGQTQVLKSNHRIQWLSVNDIGMHPHYEEIIHIDGPKFMQIKNNYAILTLTEPLVWGPTIGRALLSNTNFDARGHDCKAFRWQNAYTVDDEVLLQLVWSQEFILDAQDCQEARVDLEADEFFVHSQYRQHPMNVDSSGNPIVCGGFVVGIIIPNFSTSPQHSCLQNVLNIAPIRYLLNDVCYRY